MMLFSSLIAEAQFISPTPSAIDLRGVQHQQRQDQPNQPRGQGYPLPLPRMQQVTTPPRPTDGPPRRFHFNTMRFEFSDAQNEEQLQEEGEARAKQIVAEIRRSSPTPCGNSQFRQPVKCNITDKTCTISINSSCSLTTNFGTSICPAGKVPRKTISASNLGFQYCVDPNRADANAADGVPSR